MPNSVVIDDPLIVQFTRDYRYVMREGNSSGMTLIEYIVARWIALEPQSYAASTTSNPVFYPRWVPLGLEVGS